MTQPDTGLAHALREAFDRSFTEVPGEAVADTRDLVGISLGGDGFAVALEEIAGIFAAGRIVPLPSRTAPLLGVTGLRGAMVAVYSLQRMLGRAGQEAPRWLLLAEPHIAFGFERFDGYLRVARTQVADAGGEQNYVQAVMLAGEARRPIVSVRAMLDWIKGQRGES